MKNKFSNNVIFDSRGSTSDTGNITDSITAPIEESSAPKTDLIKSKNTVPSKNDIINEEDSVEKKIGRKKPGRKKIDPSEKKTQIALTIKQKTVDILSESGDYRRKLNLYLDEHAEHVRDILSNYYKYRYQ